MLRISGAGCCFSEDKGDATCSGISAWQKEVALPRREAPIRRNAPLNSAQTTRHVSRRRTGTYSCGLFLTYLPSGDPFSRRGPRSAHWQRDKNTAAKMLRSAPPSALKGPVQRDEGKEGSDYPTWPRPFAITWGAFSCLRGSTLLQKNLRSKPEWQDSL